MGLVPELRPVPRQRSGVTRLSSWKEIAAYLHRDPRTVQLWEKNEGLPVRRLTHNSRATVYAFKDELDAWIRTRSSQITAVQRAAPPHTESDQAGSTSSWKTTFYRKRRALLLGSGAGVLVAALAVWGFWMWSQRGNAAAKTPVLLVLPFENQTTLDEPLVEGLEADLITNLGQGGSLTVISRHAAAQYKDRSLPLHTIAEDLHATFVLQGTAARTGDQIKVTIELLDVPRGTHLWGATYTREMSEMLSSPDELASSIASEIGRRLSGTAAHMAASPHPVDPRVRQAYLQGRYLWNQRDLPGLQKAIDSFNQAIALDPKYAPAYAGLADCYVLMTDRGVISNHEAFERAKVAAQTALSLDPGSSEAYNALAFATYRRDWDFVAAERYFQRAIQLNPNYAVAHQWYGEFLGDLRRFDQSISELRKARELTPLSPMVSADLADGYLHAGRFAEAESELRRLLELYPDFVPAHQYLAAVYFTTKNLAAARSEAQIYAMRTGDNVSLEAEEVQILAAHGNVAEARERLRKLVSTSRQSITPYVAAQLYFATGQVDAGFESLEKAFKEHSWWLVTLAVDPGFNDVRNQARFQDFIRRIGLPPSALSQIS